MSAAAAAVGIRRATVYEARKTDQAFAEAMDETEGACIEQVEQTLYRRAVEGQSDTAIIFFLKSHKPEVYSDKVRTEDVHKIRNEVRDQILDEVGRQVAALPPEATEILRAAMLTLESIEPPAA